MFASFFSNAVRNSTRIVGTNGTSRFSNASLQLNMLRAAATVVPADVDRNSEASSSVAQTTIPSSHEISNILMREGDPMGAILIFMVLNSTKLMVTASEERASDFSLNIAPKK